MSTIKKLAGETIIYGIGAILPRAMNYLLVASYLTFTLDRSNYGIHGIMYAYVTVAMVIFTMRMETAFFKFGAKSSDRKHAFRGAMTIVLLTSCVLLGGMLIWNQEIAGILTRPEDGRFVIYFGLILFFDAIAAVPYASLRLENRPIKFAAIKILNSVFTIAMILFCFEIMPRYFPEWYDKSLLLDYAFVPNVIASFVVLFLLSKEILVYRFRWEPEYWKQLLRYSWPLIIVGVAGNINQFSDRLFVSYLQGGAEQNFEIAGLFTGAIKIASLMSLFITAFNYTIEPFFFKNASVEDRKRIYGPIALAFTLCACLLFLLICVNLPILQYIIGADFREGIYIVPVALMSFLILGIYYNISIWYKLSGKTIFGALISVVGTIVLIGSNFALIPQYGMIGANFASLLCFLSMCVLAYFLGQKYYPISYPIGKMFFYLGLAIAFFGIYNYLPLENNWYKMILGNGLLISFGIIAYIREFENLKSI